MGNTIQVLVVPASNDGPLVVLAAEPTLAGFCALVGDVNTDTVFFPDGAGMIKVAANGNTMGFAANARASQLTERFVAGFAARDTVMGDAVFVGLDEDSDPVDVPVSVVAAAESLFGPVSTNG